MGQEKKRSELTTLQRQGLEQLEACAREGTTIRAFAKRHRLSEQQLYQMSKLLRRKGLLPPTTRGSRRAGPPRQRAVRKPRFVEVQTVAPSSTSSSTWRAQLPNGVVLEGSSDLDRVVEALSRL